MKHTKNKRSLNTLRVAFLLGFPMTGFLSKAHGWGLVAPNGEFSNQYFQVIDSTLYRFDCPAGTVSTGKSCTSNQRALGNYPKIFASLTGELSKAIAKLKADVSVVVTRLKEADPEVKRLRGQVKLHEEGSRKVEGAVKQTDQHIAGTNRNIQLVDEESALILAALKKEPTEAELNRLLERQKRYDGLKAKYLTQKKDLETEKAANEAEIVRLSGLIKTTNQDLRDYLNKLVVTSDTLTTMEDQLDSLEAENDLVSELHGRLTDRLAYELATWEADAAPDLFARLLKHVDICAR